MRRFTSSLKRRLWVVFSFALLAILGQLSGLVSEYALRPAIKKGPGVLSDLALFFADNSLLIVPVTVAIVFVAVAFVSMWESHVRGLPLIGVDMMPWRGPKYLKGRDGKATIVQCASVSITNKTESITRDAIAESVGVVIRFSGRKLRSWSTRGMWLDGHFNIIGPRIDIHPDDVYTVCIAMESQKEKRMLAFTDSTFDSYCMDSPNGWPINEDLYFVRIRLRGVGVNHHLWFALGNFVASPESLGIWGPLSYLERIWLRLTLLGIGPPWRPYPGAKPPSEHSF